ncbi:MAG: DUF481 domain-containing protein [Kiritimatiellae bacterium]|nr:DUF481 domain-containing protein [Verrucomicrobiota bacterium]MCG2658640.1 DUF481 domain-containing protein [Kiritimatiellia bacterium]
MAFSFTWHFRRIPAVNAVVILSLAAVISRAAPMAEQEKQKQKDWNTSLNAGLNLTRGNSKNLLANGAILADYNKADNIFRLDIQGNYGESVVNKNGTNDTEQTTVQNARGVAEYQRLFSERDYGYANASLSHDRIAGIDYRGIAGPGVGRYFLKSDLLKLSTEIGVAYVCQSLAGDIENTVNLRVAQRIEMKLLATSKVWESIECLSAINDFGNYLVNFEIGAQAAITACLNLRVVLQDQFSSRPAPGKESNDVKLIAGVGYQL